jgi:hypothetical protein
MLDGLVFKGKDSIDFHKTGQIAFKGSIGRLIFRKIGLKRFGLFGTWIWLF